MHLMSIEKNGLSQIMFMTKVGLVSDMLRNDHQCIIIVNIYTNIAIMVEIKFNLILINT